MRSCRAAPGRSISSPRRGDSAAIGATWSERDQLKNREERRSYACAFLSALIRDNPDLLPEYTAAVLADEIKRGVRR